MTEAEKERAAIVESEMIEGYLDGMDLDAPEPSGNRSEAYAHGFANGRDDKRGKPRAPARFLRAQANTIKGGYHLK